MLFNHILNPLNRVFMLILLVLPLTTNAQPLEEEEELLQARPNPMDSRTNMKGMNQRSYDGFDGESRTQSMKQHSGMQHKMKKKFSSKWISSKQPRKQRKFKANAPLHTKHRFLSAPLSKTLRQKHGKRSLPLRKGDEVLVMRGSFRKKKAKVVTVELKRSRISLENIQRTKKDGTKRLRPIDPSNLIITDLNLDDKKRSAKLKQTGGK